MDLAAVRKMTRSSSMKKSAAKEEQQEGAAEPSTAHKHKKQNEVFHALLMVFLEGYI